MARRGRSLKLSETGDNAVVEVQQREQLPTWSDAVRLMLAYAAATMPPGWRPGGGR